MNWETMSVALKNIAIQEQPFLYLVPGPDTRVVWNDATQSLLHDADHVEIVVDATKKILGVKPCSGGAANAIAVHKLNLPTPRHEAPPSVRWWLDLTQGGVDDAFARVGIHWPAGQKAYLRNASQDGDVVYIPIDELMQG